MATTYQHMTPGILAAADEAAKPITLARTGSIRGPAIVYTAWDGDSCGSQHNFSALSQAAAKLGIPLYVINSDGNRDFKAERPGDRLTGDTVSLLDQFQLFLQEPNIRFINQSGRVVGSQTVKSTDGVDAIIAAYHEAIGKQFSLETERQSYGRA